MLEYRLKALGGRQPTPQWGRQPEARLRRIYYYIAGWRTRAAPGRRAGRHQDTFEKLGIPQAERDSLAGVSAPVRVWVAHHS